MPNGRTEGADTDAAPILGLRMLGGLRIFIKFFKGDFTVKKKVLLTLTAAALVIALLAACGETEVQNTPASGDIIPAASPPPVSASPEAEEPQEEAQEEPESRFMQIEHATGFSVEFLADGVTIVTDAENQRFLLVPRGQAVPPGYDDMTVVETPIQRAVLSSTTHVGMIAPFNVWGNIAGITSSHGSVPYMDMDIEASGYDIMYLGGGMAAPDYELLRLSNPDLAFVYTGTSPQTELIAMLEELGIPYAVNNEYMEMTHEGRMEWMLFFAPFFDIVDEAVSFVNEQFAMLEEMNAVIAGVERRTRVAWASISQGIVRASSPDSYIGHQIHSAGGELVWDVGGQLSLEEFYVALADADIFMLFFSNRNSVPDYEALLEMAPILEGLPVIVNEQVWQPHVGYWYFTDRQGEQVVDLAAIFHPDLFPDHEPFHFNALGE